MNATTSKYHAAAACGAFYNLLTRPDAAARIAVTRKELSAIAAKLDLDDMAQGAALRTVFAAEDSIRVMERAAAQVENHLADLLLTLKSNLPV